MGGNNPKHKETCGSCGNIWRSRAQTIENITCPKCQFRPADHPIKQKDNGRANYGKTEVNRFIKYLGLWTFVNPVDATKRRDINDYLDCLKQLIQVNKSRHDHVGRWETEAAKDALKRLG